MLPWLLQAQVPGPLVSGTFVRLQHSFDVPISYLACVARLSKQHVDHAVPPRQVLATESVDGQEWVIDAGLPKAVARLTHMGSKRFPYKGVLEHLAARCFVSAEVCRVCCCVSRRRWRCMGENVTTVALVGVRCTGHAGVD